MSVYQAVVLIQTGVLTVVSTLLLYSAVRHRRNIAHVEAFRALTAGFVSFTLAYLANLIAAPLAGRVLVFIAAVAVFVGVVLFAKPFIRVDRDDPAGESLTPVSAGDGGFADDD